MTTKHNITVQSLKAWVASNLDAVAEMEAARIVAVAERERVDAYVEPLFRTFGFVDDEGKPIDRAANLYRCEDEEACARFYAACDEAHRVRGFAGPAGHCPALVAEHAQSQAEQKVVASMCAFLGIESYQLTLEKRAELLRLIHQMAATANREVAAPAPRRRRR